MPICIDCQLDFPEYLMARKINYDGSYRYSYCKKCEAQRNKKWRQKNNKEFNAHRVEKQRMRRFANPEMTRAQKTAELALPDRQPCEVCGDPDTYRHHNDYSKPTDIHWLCPSCHNKLHHQKEEVYVS